MSKLHFNFKSIVCIAFFSLLLLTSSGCSEDVVMDEINIENQITETDPDDDPTGSSGSSTTGG